MLRFLTNYVYLSEIGLYLDGQTPSQAFARQDEWLKDKVIGNPARCPCYSWEELKAYDIVGIYAECSPSEAVEILANKIDVSKKLYNGLRLKTWIIIYKWTFILFAWLLGKSSISDIN